MIDLSQKQMYPVSPMQNDDSCPRITLPMKILGGKKVSIGDNFKITLVGEVTNITQSEYSEDVSFEVEEGELSPMAEEKGEAPEASEV